MGLLVNGNWSEDDGASAQANEKGEFRRAESVCRDWVTADGSSPFPAQAKRYHLLLAHNCPWAHRTQIARKLLGLQHAIGISFAETKRDAEGWWYRYAMDGLEPENGKLHLHRFYAASDPEFTGRVTTPTLWDSETRKVVNNESAEILRMLNGAFREFSDSELDLYPEPLREEIDEANDYVYRNVNNGVYRCGFASSQEAYNEAFAQLFEALDEIEEQLERHRYLVGNQLTEADVRLFPTLVRFDAVYVGHFKCNLRRIADYPNLSNYVRDLYRFGAFGSTVRINVYKQGYYGNSPRLNPSGIVPLGPELDFEADHDRATREYAG